MNEKTSHDPSIAKTEFDPTALAEVTATQHFDAPTQIDDQAETVLDITQPEIGRTNPPKVGSKLKDRFILVEELGKGGMGTVYKARDFRKVETHDNEPYVAIKVLNKEFQERKISVIALQREAKKAQKLAHPNIITVFDFDRDGDSVYMTMEYLEGRTLSSIIRRNRHKPIERKRALSIIEDMGRALAYAHKRGIVHSDLKPSNVFVTESNVVKVLDFGIARASRLPEQPQVEDHMFDASDLRALTPVYASKEMLEGLEPDPRDDVYGLAVVACLLLTGHHPFYRYSAKEAHTQGFKPRRLEKLPRSIRNALIHGLEFEREKRTASANQFLQELNLRSRQEKSLKRRIVEFAAVSILLLLAFIGFNEYWYEESSQSILEDTTSIADAGVREKVENLLEIAEVHTMVNRLMEPPGSSAFYAYQQVLELHKNNKQAHDGVLAIADHYERVARESLDSGDHGRAQQLVEKGLIALPAHEGLLLLKSEIPLKQSQAD
jgi:serine/threonine protein kinase